MIRDAENIKHLASKIKNISNGTDVKADVIFLWNEYDKKETINLIKHVKGIDELTYIDGAILWIVNRKDYTKSGMSKFIGTIVYKNMTARNVNTVKKIAELME